MKHMPDNIQEMFSMLEAQEYEWLRPESNKTYHRWSLQGKGLKE